MSILGTRVVRTEDPRLLTSGATYVEDLRLPGLRHAAYATFVRSPMAHARITEIDVSAALAEPGVVAVFTAKDLDDLPGGDAVDPDALSRCWPRTSCASSASRWRGRLTEQSYEGEDAAELVSVDYDPLAAVVGVGRR